jgi:tetratricopeptide (TPR) repeat protein
MKRRISIGSARSTNWLSHVRSAARFFLVLCLFSLAGCASTSGLKEGPLDDSLNKAVAPPAVIDFEQVSDPYFHLIVAEMARQNEQWRQAQLGYRYALRGSSLPAIARNGFHMSLVLNDSEAAEEFAAQWHQLDPQPESRAALATALVRTGKVDRAVEIFVEFVETVPAGGDEPFGSVASMLSRPEFSEFALPTLEGLVQRYPAEPLAALSLSRLAYRAEDLNKAFLAANRAIELDPALLDARLVRAQVLLNRGDTDAALDDLEGVLKEQPTNVRILNSVANTYLLRGDEAKAKELLLRVLAVAPDDATAILALAKTAVKSRDYSAASQYFLRLYELNEEPSLAAYYLGAVAEEGDKFDEAIDWYRRVRGGPQLERAQERIAAVMMRRGDLQLAREHLEGVRSALPHLAARFYRLEAEMLHADQRSDSAMKVFAKGIEAFPEDPDLRYSRSLLLVELGAYGLAEKDLLVALQTSPDDSKLLNALGYTLADKTQRYDEAYAYIAKALDIEPESPSIMDSMGWVLYRQGKINEAVEFLRKAYLQMREPEIAAHLGEVLWAQGERLDAESIWRSALSRSGSQGQQILKETVNRVAPSLAPAMLKGYE